ncbi:sensor histidine kinase [uncultured Winogradskyella sp.]|jgi:sensor histidine kinase YesM|uniref:sensor histidine kinase n=1 Tax=Winogradskyella sp. TaxID=1883156 RepID=UPI0025DCBE99|nr:sensor histidine kinase [uncultured Winogradskyella sp.]
MQNLNINSILKKSNYHRPLLFNSVLWSLAFIILLFIFSKGQIPITADYTYTLGFLLVIAVPVCINFYVLIPRFLRQERYIVYLLLFTTILISSAFIKSFLFGNLLDFIFPNYFFVSYLSKSDIFLTYSIFLITTTLFKLTEDWFYFNKNQNQVLKIQNQHIQTQLSALRAQINPHFLFNSLNVIYAMALEKKENITKAIVELSDVLRYVIYDSDTERVTLKEELKLIQNYIAFQKYRGHSENTVALNTDIENDNFKIYPMLLLPLLENAYKYGFSGSDTSEKIEIQLTQKQSNFKFKIQNSSQDIDHNLDDNYSGVGLENLKNNLNLVYPDKHKFNIEDTKDRFTVVIEIEDEQ